MFSMQTNCSQGLLLFFARKYVYFGENIQEKTFGNIGKAENLFSHITNRKDFCKKVFDMKCMFNSSSQLFFEFFCFDKYLPIYARDASRNVRRSLCNEVLTLWV